MRFLVIDQGAADEIVADRYLQSTEFGPGKGLAALLSGSAREVAISSRLYMAEREGGFFLISRIAQHENALIIDEISAKLFQEKPESECLLIFQKLIRFSVRYWKKLRPNRNELFVSGSTKAVVFPYPISNQTSYRIVVEREPDKKRVARRSHAQFLLAYRSGTGEGLGPTEEAPLTEFRRAIKYVESIRQEAKTAPPAVPAKLEISSLKVTAIEEAPHSQLPPQQGFDIWMNLITDPQREFIDRPLRSPHRIEGPAGTGKTLCLILKCIKELRNASSRQTEHRALFVAHSEATRKAIADLFVANDPDGFSERDRYTSQQSLHVTTLHSLCGGLLNTEISESEFLDRDAMESKNTQLLYVAEAVHEALRDDLKTHRNFLSPDFLSFLTKEDEWTISEMVQHEISVLIKGRAEDDLDKYRHIPYLNYGLPLRNDADRGFVFVIFSAYQEKLRATSQFDTDDIVLTATAQLNTPIWRRRRSREGYDSIFIDETHLFNMNELSSFHFFTRTETDFPIAYSVDRSQSLGDRGWSNESIEVALGNTGDCAPRTAMQSIFRSSPDIVNLAFSITSSGATLFTNFEDPLKFAASAFTEEEERNCAPPKYCAYTNDVDMLAGAFSRAEEMSRAMEGSRNDVLIATFDASLLEALTRFAEDANKPVEVISRRGDIEVLKRAKRSGRFILGLVDFVGGLEFMGVVLVGVDNGRVPPSRSQPTSDSWNFLNYSSHGRLYVAITRAKYRVEILGTTERGASRLLDAAFASGALLKSELGAA